MISSVNQSNDVGNKTWGMLISHCQTFTHKERHPLTKHSAPNVFGINSRIVLYASGCSHVKLKVAVSSNLSFESETFFFLVVCGFKTKWIHQIRKNNIDQMCGRHHAIEKHCTTSRNDMYAPCFKYCDTNDTYMICNTYVIQQNDLLSE